LTAYFISGLGADRRIFRNLQLPSHINIQYIEWIEPNKKESLEIYCKRLSEQINSSEDFILAGLSFGGIVAIELNKIFPAKLVLLISSISQKKELPVSFRIINKLKIHKLLPSSFYKWHNRFVNWYFGAKTKEEKELLHEFLKSSTKNYLRWSINEVLKWDNNERPSNVFHIHGTADKIFPCRNTQADVRLSGGDHLMVYDMPAEVSKALTERIISIST
jgi:hypothetical protein